MADKQRADDQKHVYDESKIKTLSSLEHIRLRTGMYIGRIGDGSHYDDGCYILLKEVIDNGIDEFIMGYGKELQVEIQETMSKYAPIVRHGSGLETGLEKILELGRRAKSCGTGGSPTLAFNPGWHTAIDLHSMLVNGEALFRSALERKESRGAHARSDFPKTEEQLEGVNFVVEKSPDGMLVRPERRPQIPSFLAEAVSHAYARYTPEEME